ncbi:sensor histidine kinase [Planktotalea sp.]|uniref:sensor histidine kinase n=1 Tax=Planktotalea sp. TaxID=2029877 RepID=UPI003F6BBA0E
MFLQSLKQNHLEKEARSVALLMVGAFGILTATMFFLFPVLERAYLGQLAQKEAATLTLAVEGLNGSLRRFEALPTLIAERPEVISALRKPSDAELIARVNADLEETAELVGLSDVFLLDRSGLTIAASNYWKDRTFIGQSFQYRPYFTDALSGAQGRFFALGTTSGERGYFFAEAVRDGPDVIGVLAVKFTVDQFEEAWGVGDNVIAVVDNDSVVFMSNRPAWHFRSFAPLTAQSRVAIQATRKYPIDQLGVLESTQSSFGDNLNRRVVTDDENQTEEFIVQTRAIPDAQWEVWLLTPTGPAWNRAMTTIGLAATLFLLAGLIVIVVIQRRVQLQERMKAALSMKEELEQRVTQRTAELNEANRNIMQEVEERRDAETRLRQTQTELVQAGKLAALGQMSAALSHEFNQPLTAVKSFANNALAYLDRGEPEKVRQNVGMIDDMVDRLVAISTHLRNFARRPSEKTQPVLLNQAIESALAIIEPKLRGAGCHVNWLKPDDQIWVQGGQVRLQQVLVNLLSNAIDAMKNTDEKCIDMTVKIDAATACVEVRDLGTGMTQENIAQLFDPFYTTKEPGQGMGLGLSISYNIVKDFGGSLTGRNHPEGGAIFSVWLTRCVDPTAQKVAE